MANTDQELKQLNKTVSDAVNMLKAFWGSSAQVRNATEEQKKILDKWFKIVEEEEDQQKKKRKFVERERDAFGRFKKQRQEGSKAFLGMAKSVGGMFKKMTTNVASGIKSFAQGLMSHFSNFFQAVKNQFLGLFGEESEWFELLGSIKDSITGFAGSVFEFLFRRTPRWAKEQTKVLKKMLQLQIKQMKKEFLTGAGKNKKGDRSAWGVFLMAVGAAIGALLHRSFVLISKLPIFKKVVNMFKFLDKVPFLNKLIKGLKFGFRWFGWPITLLLSVIDFIRGFADSEGSLLEKVKEGLWKALEGFIELPLRFIGWVVEKVLNLFGVEVEGLGQKFVNVTKQLFFMAIDGWVMIFDMIKKGVTMSVDSVIGMITTWKDPLMDAISPIINGVKNFFVNFWNTAVDWMASMIPSWLPDGVENKLVAGIKNMKIGEEVDSGASAVHEDRRLKRFKIMDETGRSKEIKDGMDKLSQDINRSNAQTQNAITSLQNVQNNAGGGVVSDTQQIPDEVDPSLALFNYAGGMS